MKAWETVTTLGPWERADLIVIEVSSLCLASYERCNCLVNLRTLRDAFDKYMKETSVGCTPYFCYVADDHLLWALQLMKNLGLFYGCSPPIPILWLSPPISNVHCLQVFFSLPARRYPLGVSIFCIGTAHSGFPIRKSLVLLDTFVCFRILPYELNWQMFISLFNSFDIQLCTEHDGCDFEHWLDITVTKLSSCKCWGFHSCDC
jgi:hypothetical protein